MSESFNFAALAEASEAQRQNLNDRVSGRTPADEGDKGATPEEVATAIAAASDLTAAESEALAAKVEAGEPTAIAILEEVLAKGEDAGEAPQAGDGGGRGKPGAIATPFEIAEAHIRHAVMEGRRRQTGRKA